MLRPYTRRGKYLPDLLTWGPFHVRTKMVWLSHTVSCTFAHVRPHTVSKWEIRWLFPHIPARVCGLLIFSVTVLWRSYNCYNWHFPDVWGYWTLSLIGDEVVEKRQEGNRMHLLWRHITSCWEEEGDQHGEMGSKEAQQTNKTVCVKCYNETYCFACWLNKTNLRKWSGVKSWEAGATEQRET